MDKIKTKKQGIRINFVLSKGILIAACSILVVVLVGGVGTATYVTSQPAFCGAVCHIMNEPYEAWKKDKHFAPDGDTGKQADCIECHFLPGEKTSFKGTMEGLRHLAAYLYDRDAHMPVRPVVKDGACLRSGCHVITKFQDKEVKYGEKSTFKHKAHFEKDVLKGQPIYCDTCHVKHSAKKHFETPKEICFTCHLRLKGAPKGDETTIKPILIKASFKRTATDADEKAKDGIAKKDGAKAKDPDNCALCHKLPTKSLQQQLSAEDKSKNPITHQTLEKAKVPCASCHLHQVQPTAAIKTAECLDCHSASEDLYKKGMDGKLMHDEHVATPRADCLACHQPSRHGGKPDYLDAVRTDCGQCHKDQHRFQRILLAGAKVSENVSPVPGLMNAVKTNCAACHTKQKHTKDQLVMTGSGESCAGCHTKDHPKMLDDWIKLLEREVLIVKETETEALEALAAAEGKFDAAQLLEAKERIVTGQKLLNVVQVGNGVHNKKYSIMILDEAITNFEDTIDQLESAQ